MNEQEIQSKKGNLRQKLGLWFWVAPAVIIVLVIALVLLVVSKKSGETGLHSILRLPGQNAPQGSFTDGFVGNYRLAEAGSLSDSANPNWWVNSGGWMIVSDGTGKTVQGDLDPNDKWYKKYAKSNPTDTDGGAHPQNIFRLVGRKKWQNFSQEVYFRINKMNFSESPNRNESNGFLLFNRYQDGDNLYYTGLRVDGYSVIKKKLNGDYHTLAEEKIFPGPEYDRDSSPNLLPVGKWMGIRSTVETNKSGGVEINLYYSAERGSGDWKLVAHYVDTGQKGDEIVDPGYGGIRTDFMDVEFADYSIKSL